jgi:hypothetical protein
MAGRTSGIKTATDFFPELRIMQINRAILNKGIYGYVLFLSKQVLDVQESYMYPFRSSLFGGC